MMVVSEPTDSGCAFDRPTTSADGLIVIGQLGQSLDGQIATATGHSKYINGQGGLAHLHRLRAWADVVVIGVGTLVADNPRLNVRLASGSNPDRVIVDPRGRSPQEAICFTDTTVRRVVLTSSHAQPGQWPHGVEVVRFPTPGPQDPIATHEIRRWLASQGWRRVLVEGGAGTLSAFLAQGSLDRLHLIVSPMLLGPGISGVGLPGVSQLSRVQRFRAASYRLGDDLLIDCSFG